MLLVRHPGFIAQAEHEIRKFILVNFSVNDKMTALYLATKVVICSLIKKLVMMAMTPKTNDKRHLTLKDSVASLVMNQASTLLYGASSLILLKTYVFRICVRLIKAIIYGVFNIMSSFISNLATVASLTGTCFC